MTTKRILSIFIFLLVIATPALWAAERSITLPKGTVSKKIGPGHYQFTLPDQRIVEVAGFKPATGTFSLLRVVSGHKVEWGGKQGRLVDAKRLSRHETDKAQKREWMYLENDSFALPMRFSIAGDMSSNDLLSAFLKLNINDPDPNAGKDEELLRLAQEMKKQAKESGEAEERLKCHHDGGQWDAATKTCVK